MNYPGILKVVKAQNPDMPHKQAMKKAKEMFAKFKAASAELSPIVTKTEAVSLPAGTIAKDVLIAAEVRLREHGVNVSSIYNFGREVMPDGDLIKHGKVGLNSQVTLEDGRGNRFPVEGYFIVWI